MDNLREQIQKDIISLISEYYNGEGTDLELTDGLCQIIVDRFKEYEIRGANSELPKLR